MAENPYVNKVVYGNDTLIDISDTTATAADVLTGKNFYTADGALATGIAPAAIPTTWFGAKDYEFLKEFTWSAKLNEADNWPLTATTASQTLKWKTAITTTANANATFARYGKGYDGDQLDFGTYGYFFLQDVMAHLAYTSEESELGTLHIIGTTGETSRSWGPRPRAVNGTLIYPSTSDYGAYAAVAYMVNMTLYRDASGLLQLTNNSTYGVSITFADVTMKSTSTVKPDYFNIRIPTFGIRAHDSYMPVASFADLDASKTVLACRIRLYRVPVANAIYTKMNLHMLNDMILGNKFPDEVV